ncbi:MAG: phospholipid carrier-dependent glycosyltransferase [Betaproteobacteria bacterium]
MLAKSGASPKIGLILFWGAFIVFWFATLGQRALIHPDEGRYAELSLGMLQSGDWITPRLNGILYFEKPAMQYWMGAISFLIFGINEFAARFWPALTGILSVAAVGLTARRIWGNGHYAALVMGGSVWVIANSHFVNLDTGLLFFLTLTLCAFLWSQNDAATSSEQRYGMWIAWAAMAGATLSKGLIGLVIPAGALFLYSLLHWQWGVLRRMQWLPGLAIFLALTVPWFWMVSERNPDFARFFFIHEHFERFLTNTHRREEPFWFFIPVLLAGFLPWSSLLPRLVTESFRRQGKSHFQTGRFLLIWAVFVFLFFTKSGSKLPSYILPMFPALALLLGRTLANAQPQSLKKHLIIPIALWGLIACASLIVDHVPTDEGTPMAVLRHFSLYLSAGGLGFLVCAVLAWRSLSHGKTLPAIMLLAAGSLWGVLASSAGHDAIGQLKSSKQIVEQIRPHLRPDTEIFSIQSYDQTFPFYLQRRVIQVEYKDEFSFGQGVEPDKAVPTLGEFIQRWKAARSAMAMMENATFNDLQNRGVEMKPIYQDVRRKVVIKP